MLHEVLLAEVIARIVLIQLLQSLLQLQHHEGEGESEPQERLLEVSVHPKLWGWGQSRSQPHLVPGWAGKTGTAKKLPAQEVPIILQEGQIEVTEELHVLVLHPQLLGRVPVDHLGSSVSPHGREVSSTRLPKSSDPMLTPLHLQCLHCPSGPPQSQKRQPHPP